MARDAGRLTALKVKKANVPGMHCDGGGLYLRVMKQGTKNWVLRFMLAGRPRWMGLGPVSLISLQQARAKALDARRLRHEGTDPIDARRAARRQALLDAAKSVTFRKCAASYISAHKAGWSNPKHAAQWTATLATYADPIMGALPVQAIDTALVMSVIEPLWPNKPETAGRLRGRIEAILDWAKARGFRQGENPARWRGHVDILLPARGEVRRVRHQPAMPFQDLPGFMAKLRGMESISARALEFTVLTAARTGATIGALWSEIDLVNAIWTVPGDRAGTKLRQEIHRVPLSRRAIEILRSLPREVSNDHIFIGAKKGRGLSNMAMLELLQGRHPDFTVHGFRSSFKDWAAETTNHPDIVSEMALAHVVSDDVKAAYRRGDLFDKRKRLMTAWSEFCRAPSKSSEVTTIRRAAL